MRTGLVMDLMKLSETGAASPTAPNFAVGIRARLSIAVIAWSDLAGATPLAGARARFRRVVGR